MPLTSLTKSRHCTVSTGGDNAGSHSGRTYSLMSTLSTTFGSAAAEWGSTAQNLQVYAPTRATPSRAGPVSFRSAIICDFCRAPGHVFRTWPQVIALPEPFRSDLLALREANFASRTQATQSQVAHSGQNPLVMHQPVPRWTASRPPTRGRGTPPESRSRSAPRFPTRDPRVAFAEGQGGIKRLHGPNDGTSASGALVWPLGRWKVCPDTSIDDERPW